MDIHNYCLLSKYLDIDLHGHTPHLYQYHDIFCDTEGMVDGSLEERLHNHMHHLDHYDLYLFGCYWDE